MKNNYKEFYNEKWKRPSPKKCKLNVVVKKYFSAFNFIYGYKSESYIINLKYFLFTDIFLYEIQQKNIRKTDVCTIDLPFYKGKIFFSFSPFGSLFVMRNNS